MECSFCKKKFKNKYILETHQKTAQYCLKIQKKSTQFVCEYCGKHLTTKRWLINHYQSCINYIVHTQTSEYKEKIISLESQVSEQKETIKELQDKLENIALQAVKRPFDEETTIEINEDGLLSDSDFTIEESDTEEDEYKQLPKLEVGKGYNIEHREEDGYINVTNLCKAGDKLFKNWKKTQKTKAFLQVLSSSVPIRTDELIKYKSGSIHERSTWVHPQVAINIAQWISPSFDVKVSGWVYEIMMTGKVDITNTTSFKKLQEENKGHKLRIQYLTKKYVKSQPREQYKEKYVIYILTTTLMKKERRYILGKATNLTHRLYTYNKSDEHEVIYYQECGDEETMTLVENMVFHQLEEYREQANRERFILPKTEEINFFSEKINTLYFQKSIPYKNILTHNSCVEVQK